VFLVNAELIAKESVAMRQTAARHPAASFLLYDSHSTMGPLLEALDLPLAGFVTFNHLSTADLVRSLDVIAHGGAVIEPYTAQLLIEYLRGAGAAPSRSEANASASLTEREQEVLGLVRQGLSNKEIAYQLRISLGTVRAHMRSIFRKLDVSSRAGAAAYFRPPGSRDRLAG
jgi:DNA-binding NarL/FixJ family response regulator